MRSIAVLGFVLCAPVLAQGHHRQKNEALLGIVPAETKRGVEVAHVLKKTPAQKAKLHDGDVLVEVAGKKVERAPDVDAALRGKKPGDVVEVAYERKGKKATAKVKLIARKDYEGPLAKRRRRGATGHAMPAWYAYKWANVKKGEEPPTPENTKGKVLVLHTFQSW